MIILDTNVISEIMRPEPNPAVLHWLDAQYADELYISAIVKAEIEMGIAILDDGKRKQALFNTDNTLNIEVKMKNYSYIQELIDDGYLVTFNDTNTGKKLIIVSDEGGDVISFPRGRMSYEKYMTKLNDYAKKYLENNEHNLE